MNETEIHILPLGRTESGAWLQVATYVAWLMQDYARLSFSRETRSEAFASAVSVNGDILVLTLHPDDITCYAYWQSTEIVTSVLTCLGFVEVVFIIDEKRPTLVK